MVIIKKIINFFVSLIFPQECVNCGVVGDWICSDCLSLIDFQPANFCNFCKSFSFLGIICQNCKKDYYLDGLFSFSSYNNLILRKIIHNYKYNNVKSLGNNLSLFLAIILKNIEKAQAIKSLPLIIDKHTLFFAVPLHYKRKRQRGFNQVELLLNNLVSQKIIPTENIAAGLLRIKYIKPQAKIKDKKKRLRNLQEAFVYKGDNLNNKRIVLIDDVATTGATFNECAKILKKNGAKKVYGIAVARG